MFARNAVSAISACRKALDRQPDRSNIGGADVLIMMLSRVIRLVTYLVHAVHSGQLSNRDADAIVPNANRSLLEDLQCQLQVTICRPRQNATAFRYILAGIHSAKEQDNRIFAAGPITARDICKVVRGCKAVAMSLSSNFVGPRSKFFVNSLSFLEVTMDTGSTEPSDIMVFIEAVHKYRERLKRFKRAPAPLSWEYQEAVENYNYYSKALWVNAWKF